MVKCPKKAPNPERLFTFQKTISDTFTTCNFATSDQQFQTVSKIVVFELRRDENSSLMKSYFRQSVSVRLHRVDSRFNLVVCCRLGTCVRQAG